MSVKEHEQAALGRSKKCICGICGSGGLGIVLSLIVFAIFWTEERLELGERFSASAEPMAVAVQESVDQNARELKTFAHRVGESLPLTRSKFEALAGPIVSQNSGLSALNWIPKVPHEERDQVEAYGRSEHSAEFQFLDEGRMRTYSRAKDSSEYFPILFTEPYASNSPALGLDVSSNPKSQGALISAGATGETKVSLPFRLKQESGYQNAYVLLQPIYEGHSVPAMPALRKEMLLGFVEGVYRAGDVVLAALEFLFLEDLQIWLFDVEDANEFPFVFVEISEGSPKVSLASRRKVDKAKKRRGMSFQRRDPKSRSRLGNRDQSNFAVSPHPRELPTLGSLGRRPSDDAVVFADFASHYGAEKGSRIAVSGGCS